MDRVGSVKAVDEGYQRSPTQSKLAASERLAQTKKEGRQLTLQSA
jgi:hypothetical protein